MGRPDPATHAVVLGAGMAGLFAAGVLSEFFASVTVVERDELPREPLQRKGIPQGRHLHRLLSRGSQLIEEFFPGILAELVAAGAEVDDGDLSRTYVRFGRYALPQSGEFRDRAALVTYATSRSLLECHVRQRVAGLSNVAILDGHDVMDPIAPTPERVTGVRVADRRTGREHAVAADLVVDAMGRSARTPAFLDALGYGRPPERRSDATATYASQFLRIPADAIAQRLVMVQPHPQKPGGLLAATEHDTWVLSLGQLAVDWEPPANFDEMLSVSDQFMPESVMAGLRRAQPVGDVDVFRFRGATWRRYDQMARLPTGLLAIGDALCSLNPTYGQGMTVAALQAVALREYLLDGDDRHPQRFFAAAAQHIGPVWAMNQARDTPPVAAEGRHSPAKRLTGWIVNQALQAAGHDIALAERFYRVNHLVDPPTRMQDPALIARAIAANQWRRLSRST